MLKEIISFSKPEDLPEDFTITFHAGFNGTKENTVESVKEAVKKDPQIIEFDVTFRKDGTPVMIHSSNPGDNEGELLDDAFAVVATHPSCLMNLDIKNPSNLPAVEALLEKHGIKERAFYTGIGEDWVDITKKTSTVPYYLNHFLTIKEATDEAAALELVEKIKSLGAIGLNSNFLNANKKFVDIARKNGILVSFWTANKKIEMKYVLSSCPDNITTEHPDVLRELLK